MINADVRFKLLYPDVKLPEYAIPGDSGADVRAYFEDGESKKIYIGKRLLIPTGLQVAYIEPGYEIQIRPRSGLAYKNGLTVLNTPGTIDNPYRGHLCVILINHDIMFHEISHGDRIAQIVVCPVVTAKFSVVDDIVLTERSDGGFGHTGME